jgi:hypothetical protein
MDLSEFNKQMRSLKQTPEKEQIEFINKLFPYDYVECLNYVCFYRYFKDFTENAQNEIYINIKTVFEDCFSKNNKSVYVKVFKQSRFFANVDECPEIDIKRIFSSLSLDILRKISKDIKLFNKIQKKYRVKIAFIESIFEKINDDDDLLEVYKNMNEKLNEGILLEFDNDFIEKDRKLSFLLIRHFTKILTKSFDETFQSYYWYYYVPDYVLEFKKSIQNEYMYNKMKKYYTYYFRKFKDFIAVWITYSCFIKQDEEMYNKFVEKFKQYGLNNQIYTQYFKDLKNYSLSLFKEEDTKIYNGIMMYRKLK